MERAKSGDAAAFQAIVEDLHLRVFRFLLRMVGSTSDAEDLTQDVFIEVYRKLDRFRGESKLSTWVIGIAFNMGRSFLRRAPDRRFTMTEIDEVHDLAADQADPERITRSRDAMQAFEQALADLSDELREALTLVSLQGLAYEEAAEIAGVPLGTMKTRVFRARKQARDILDAQDALDLVGIGSAEEN